MKYVLVITVLAFVAAFVAAIMWLPDPLYYLAGHHKGEVFATGFTRYMFSAYLALLVAAFAAFLPGCVIQETLEARRH